MEMCLLLHLGKDHRRCDSYNGSLRGGSLTGIVANAFANQVARRKAILEAEVANALLDGEISDQEQEKIESLRKRSDLSEDHVDAIIEVFKDTK